ncbi:MAG TPA: cell division protein FtsQ [Flavobacterium sp.]
MKKCSWNAIWINARLLCMFGFLIFLYSFTSHRNENREITKTAVEFVGDDNQYLSHETVNKLLIENNKKLTTIRKVNLDLNTLEKRTNSNPMVEKSEVFVTIDGVLKARIVQKTPIVRVVGDQGSFYIDYQGSKMPLSNLRSARVPLVSGNTEGKNKKELIELFRFIYDDDFLQKNIIGIALFDNGAIKMTDRNYNYEIDFGSATNIEKKFNNYKAFFQKTMQDNSIIKYKKVTLRFTQQVVCTK